MKERPLIFGAWKMRYLLSLAPGQEAQTRRVVRWPILSKSDGAKRRVFVPDDVTEINELIASRQAHPCRRVASPYGLPGDRIWPREAWQVWGWREGDLIIRYAADGARRECFPTEEHDWERYALESDDDCEKAGTGRDAEGMYSWPDSAEAPTRKRNPMFMPRWASRLSLDLVALRVERLQEISEEDARAEGARHFLDELDGRAYDNAERSWGRWTKRLDPDARVASHRGALAAAWERINGQREGCSWADNPWVWCLTLRRLASAEVAA